MKNALLLDTNTSSFPIYQYLERSCNNVFVMGKNPNDFLARAVKNFINVDYSNIEEVQKIIDSYSIEYLVPGCNDFSYSIAAQLNSDNRFYNIESSKTTDTINNKGEFREMAHLINLPVPAVFSREKLSEVRPLIVKPVDAYSGRGVTIVSEPGQHLLSDAIEKAEKFSRSGTIVVEEYVQGQLYSHSAFISDGEIVIDFIVEEHGTANPFVVDTSKVTYDFPVAMLNRIRDSISKMTRHLKLKNGLIHTQFILSHDNFWIIEITKRCPGDLYSRLIEISTGFPYAEFYARPFLNMPMTLGNVQLRKERILRHTVSQKQEDLFSSIKFNHPVLLEEMVTLSLSGSILQASPFDRIALIFIKSETESEFSRLWSATLNRRLYNLK